MKRLRFWLVVFSGWLFLLYNIERIHEPINFASFIYVLLAVVAVLVLAIPWLQKVALSWQLVPTAAVILVLKMQLGYPIVGAYLPITVSELFSVGVTIVLARQLGRRIEEFRASAVNTLVSHVRDKSLPFEHGQEAFYREVRRARAHHRPLTLLAISARPGTDDLALDRFTKDFQRDTLRAYSRARLAELLTKELKDYAVITRSGDDFFALLPETDQQAALEFTKRLETQARDQLKLDVQVGLSCFPDEEVTFVELLERARRRMHSESGNGTDAGAKEVNGRKYRNVNGDARVLKLTN